VSALQKFYKSLEVRLLSKVFVMLHLVVPSISFEKFVFNFMKVSNLYTSWRPHVIILGSSTTAFFVFLAPFSFRPTNCIKTLNVQNNLQPAV